MSSIRLRDLVFDALGNAQDNGAFAVDGQLYLSAGSEVAEDLMRCCADIESFPAITVGQLLPHIAAWRAGAV